MNFKMIIICILAIYKAFRPSCIHYFLYPASFLIPFKVTYSVDFDKHDRAAAAMEDGSVEITGIDVDVLLFWCLCIKEDLQTLEK